jgi:hypothetical protein
MGSQIRKNSPTVALDINAKQAQLSLDNLGNLKVVTSAIPFSFQTPGGEVPPSQARRSTAAPYGQNIIPDNTADRYVVVGGINTDDDQYNVLELNTDHELKVFDNNSNANLSNILAQLEAITNEANVRPNIIIRTTVTSANLSITCKNDIDTVNASNGRIISQQCTPLDPAFGTILVTTIYY